MNKTYEALEFNKILETLAEYTLSDGAKERSLCLSPNLNIRRVLNNMRETTEAKELTEKLGSPPLSVMLHIDCYIDEAIKGGMLSCAHLEEISTFVNTCNKMKRYLEKGEALDIELAFIGNSFYDISSVSNEIENAIENGNVDDRASKELREIRKKVDNTKAKIKDKLNTILKNNKSYFADNFVSTRNGRLTLPLKKEYKSKIDGIVIDTSKTGETIFIEPNTVRKMQDEISFLEISEENEIRRILYVLSEMVAQNEKELKLNLENMENLDFIFAKAKLSIHLGGSPPIVSIENEIKIINGRHPLIDPKNVVPLNFEIGDKKKGVIITGPNTGGKTVALKTVGLLTLMAQSGLHIPAENLSVICLRDIVLCDIGDGQSISENLSTFSAHMSNIITILEKATEDSLVLLDELGSGTDPSEGMGLAVAILEELSSKGCLIMATTHYPEIKDFAHNTDGFTNARMTFHKESLEPLFSLEIGEAGESCALYIAEKLGFSEHILKRAHEVVYSKVNDSCKINFHSENKHQKTKTKPSILDKQLEQKQKAAFWDKFQVGDSVKILPSKEIGIICKKPDDIGNYKVLIKGEKTDINHKRLKLHVAAKELYPADYDFSVIFDSVENRKGRKLIEKGKGDGVVIRLEE